MITKTTLGGGCFWCTEAVFQKLKGVKEVVSGYMGGETKSPTYKEICTGTTGHAEVVQITFDTSDILFEEILNVFFATHDPTTLNQQGADRGTQYRSVIFPQDIEQELKAKEFIELLNKKKVFESHVVTQIQSISTFYPAEGYHQNYYNVNSSQRYCNFVIAPKLKKLEELFEEILVK